MGTLIQFSKRLSKVEQQAKARADKEEQERTADEAFQARFDWAMKNLRGMAAEEEQLKAGMTAKERARVEALAAAAGRSKDDWRADMAAVGVNVQALLSGQERKDRR